MEKDIELEKVIELLNRMQADGVIEKFAIGGGIAPIYYLLPYNTDDVDVFMSPVVVSEGGLLSFGRIYSYLQALGYQTVPFPFAPSPLPFALIPPILKR